VSTNNRIMTVERSKTRHSRKAPQCFSSRTTISGCSFWARFGSGLIGLTGTNDVIIMEEASESTSESFSSLGLSEVSDELSDEEEVDISESSS
jgi:hypothetical protein